MQADTITKNNFFTTRRSWMLLIGIVLFMPPLSFLFQFTQDSSFCGSWCPRMFFTWRDGQTAGAFLSGMVRSYMGVALVLGAVISTFFLGRIWCSHLCPVGGTSELGSRLIPEALKVRLDMVPAASVRYGYLAAYLLLPALGLGSLCCNYCNFATVPRFLGASFSQADMAFFFRTAGLIDLGLLVALGFFTKGGRGYCNLLCPVGALDALSNKAGERFGKRMRIDADRCNGCARCQDACPLWAIDIGEKAGIDQLSCISCGLCMKACPKDAIAYRLKEKSKEALGQADPVYALSGRGGKELAL
jgi:ferredoxin-type protein NapH